MNLNEAQQRIRGGVIAVLIGLAIVFMVLDSTGNLEGLFSFVRDPISVLMQWTSGGTDTVAEALSGPRDLQAAAQEINTLQAQIDTLLRENAQLREDLGTYRQIEDLFARASETPEFQRVLASVIAYNTSPYFQSIIIDKGSADGVVVGMPVEAARGLVGQVFRTSPHAAQVLLVSDNISSIPARLVDSRATGLLRGGGLGGSMALNWIDLEAPVMLDEIVVTSGLGGRFPPDLVIGRVIEVQRGEAELHQRAIVQPTVNFDSLEEVFVITDFQPTDTTLFDQLPDS